MLSKKIVDCAGVRLMINSPLPAFPLFSVLRHKIGSYCSSFGLLEQSATDWVVYKQQSFIYLTDSQVLADSVSDKGSPLGS